MGLRRPMASTSLPFSVRSFKFLLWRSGLIISEFCRKSVINTKLAKLNHFRIDERDGELVRIRAQEYCRYCRKQRYRNAVEKGKQTLAFCRLEHARLSATLSGRWKFDLALRGHFAHQLKVSSDFPDHFNCHSILFVMANYLSKPFYLVTFVGTIWYFVRK